MAYQPIYVYLCVCVLLNLNPHDVDVPVHVKFVVKLLRLLFLSDCYCNWFDDGVNFDTVYAEFVFFSCYSLTFLCLLWSVYYVRTLFINLC